MSAAPEARKRREVRDEERRVAHREALAELPRRERRKQEVRGRILEAAFALFEEQGYRAAKVSDIADRADVAHKTFFNHFPSKRHLLREIAGEALANLLADLEDVRKRPGSTTDRLLAFFTLLADNAEERGPMQRDLLTEIIHVIHETGNESQEAVKIHRAFGAIVEEGIARGDVTTAHDVATLTEMIQGAFYALMFGFANLEDYPLRQRAIAAARFLGEALSPQASRGET